MAKEAQVPAEGAGSGAFLLFYRKLLCVFIFFACTNHKYLLETLDICIICIVIINTNDTYFYAIGNFVPENYAVMFLHILAKSENICKIEYRINEIGRE